MNKCKMRAEDQFGDVNPSLDACCPRCKSRNTIMAIKEGYFWIDRCQDCGYKGNEGDPVGCLI